MDGWVITQVDSAYDQNTIPGAGATVDYQIIQVDQFGGIVGGPTWTHNGGNRIETAIANFTINELCTYHIILKNGTPVDNGFTVTLTLVNPAC